MTGKPISEKFPRRMIDMTLANPQNPKFEFGTDFSPEEHRRVLEAHLSSFIRQHPEFVATPYNVRRLLEATVERGYARTAENFATVFQALLMNGTLDSHTIEQARTMKKI